VTKKQGARSQIKEQSWETFRDSGLLWFVNRTLHIFGWSIIIVVRENESIARVYPAKTSFKDFSAVSNMRGFKRMKKLMKGLK